MEAEGPKIFDIYDDHRTKNRDVVVAKKLRNFGMLVSETVLKSQGFQTLINYPENFNFDLVIIDGTFAPPLLGFMIKFKLPPVVTLESFGVPHYIYYYYKDIIEPGKHIFNVFVQSIEQFEIRREMYLNLNTLMRIYFENFMFPSIEELEKMMSRRLVDSHLIIEKVEPLSLSINATLKKGILIEDLSPLENDIETFIQFSPNGIVLVSLGTMIENQSLSQQAKTTIIKVFEDLPQYNFLIEHDFGHNIPLPKNVKILRGFNQTILAHPNIKAFITNGDILQIEQATWWGIPILGIPSSAIQYKNMNLVFHADTGIQVNHNDINYASLKAALLEVLQNPKYLRNSKERGTLFREQPQRDLDRTIYWLKLASKHQYDNKSNEPSDIDQKKIRYEVLITLLFVVLFSFCFKNAVFHTLKRFVRGIIALGNYVFDFAKKYSWIVWICHGIEALGNSIFDFVKKYPCRIFKYRTSILNAFIQIVEAARAVVLWIVY